MNFTLGRLHNDSPSRAINSPSPKRKKETETDTLCLSKTKLNLAPRIHCFDVKYSEMFCPFHALSPSARWQVSWRLAAPPQNFLPTLPVESSRSSGSPICETRSWTARCGLFMWWFHECLWHWNGLLCADVPLRNCSLHDCSPFLFSCLKPYRGKRINASTRVVYRICSERNYAVFFRWWKSKQVRAASLQRIRVLSHEQ